MMDLRTGIVQTAHALGMSPVDLASIISYETAGTFNPTKAGPTTQWGQHRGLIQFGEPQAQQYGVDWNNPVASQLGPEGAVANYFRSSGWQPGMGLLDAYSIVNAGAPGRYNASDANNGGAAGTVADKVNNQFAPHIAKAQAFLGDALPTQPNLSFGAGVPSMGSPLAGMFGGDMPTSMGEAISSAAGQPQQTSLADMYEQKKQEREGEEQRRKEALFGSMY